MLHRHSCPCGHLLFLNLLSYLLLFWCSVPNSLVWHSTCILTTGGLMSPDFLLHHSQGSLRAPELSHFCLVVLQATLCHSHRAHLYPDTGQMASSPIKDAPMLGPALGSHPVQMDDVARAFLCFTPWGCSLWALLCCSKCFEISALRSSKVCSLSVGTAQFLCSPPSLLMQTLPFTGIHSSIEQRISVPKTVLGTPKSPLPGRVGRRSLSCFLFAQSS